MSLDQRGTRPPVKSLAPPGVYAPQEDTALLSAALADEPLAPGAAVLDVGTGSGALALAAARRGARVTAVDVSRRAVCAARLNALRAGLPVRVLRGNLFEPVRGRSFDLVLANPPYVPALARTGRRAAARPARGTRAVTGGSCSTASATRRRGCCGPAGCCCWVQSALSDPGRTVDCLRSRGAEGGGHAAAADRLRAGAEDPGGVAAGARAAVPGRERGRAGGDPCRAARLIPRGPRPALRRPRPATCAGSVCGARGRCWWKARWRWSWRTARWCPPTASAWPCAPA